MDKILTAGCAIALVSIVSAATCSTSNAAAAAANDAQMQFEQLKTLVGTWDAPLGKGGTMTDIFRPMGSGTAILHEEWKDGEQLTATVFYVVGRELHADHFCDLGNQLQYVAKASSAPNTIALELRGSTNLDTHPRHFHSTTWTFVDANRHTQDWQLMDAQATSKNIHLEFKRRP